MPRNRATNETIHPRFATYLSPASSTPHWNASSFPFTPLMTPFVIPSPDLFGPTTPDEPRHISARSWRVPFESVQKQRHNRSPNDDGQMAFPGYFDPLAVVPIIDTTNLLARIFATVPRFLYFSMFLFLPYFYHARVNQILRGVHLTENELASHYRSGHPPSHWRPTHWENVKVSWSAFVDSVVKEWGTLNLVSVLLLS